MTVRPPICGSETVRVDHQHIDELRERYCSAAFTGAGSDTIRGRAQKPGSGPVYTYRRAAGPALREPA